MINYSMAGRTYRCLHGNPLYLFDNGLSYSTFNFTNAYTLQKFMVDKLMIEDTDSRL